MSTYSDVDFCEDSAEDDNFQEDIDTSSEEEVLPITNDETSSEGETEMNENDDEDYWGNKKITYYGADFVDKDRGKTYREEDLEIHNAEREAAELQLRATIQLEKGDSFAYLEDYDRSVGLISKKFPLISGEGELQDTDNLKIQKLKYESKKFPKLSEFKENFKEKFNEINEKLAPLLELSEKINLDEDLIYCVKLKYSILLHYLLNLQFCLLLKCEEKLVENHPVYKRIEQFKNLDEKLNSLMYPRYSREIDRILQSGQSKSKLPIKISKDFCSSKNSSNAGKNKGLISKLCDVDMEETLMKSSLSEIEEIEQNPERDTREVEDEKRIITYQIAKNKGLIVKRKRELKNPRVHNRMKYRKAKIRRKGQVRSVIKEMKRYAGEPTGISAHVIRSIKIK